MINSPSIFKIIFSSVIYTALFLVFSFLASASLIPSHASALSLSPAKATFFIDPSSQASNTITIHNDSPVTKKFAISVLGARLGQNGAPEFGVGFDIAESWVKLDVETATILPGEVRDVPYVISVPQDAVPSAHYVGLAINEAATPQSAVGLSGRLVSIIYIQVAGLVREELAVSPGSATPIYPWKVSRAWPVAINNIGTIPVPLTGKIEVTTANNKKIYSAPLTLGNNLIPGAWRQISVPLSLEGARWPGFYSARFFVQYGQSQSVIVKNSAIFYTPKWLVVLVGAGLLLVTGLLFRTKRLARRLN
ncbi:MAG: hypothetical protein Q7K39_00130 [Candidatus Magasanikbacteria bacterium]|nr:hypothetical protein [Candidatus Magasanikbacteria bacterium]